MNLEYYDSESCIDGGPSATAWTGFVAWTERNPKLTRTNRFCEEGHTDEPAELAQELSGELPEVTQAVEDVRQGLVRAARDAQHTLIISGE